MKVSVFGSAHPKPGDTEYLEAYRLGKCLAERGYIVLNGGYVGTMEAVSKGTAEAGGHVIGVTCDDIERWRNDKPNPWVHEVMHHTDLFGRISGLVRNCDAAIALPGGVGTLAEIALTWNMIILESIPVPYLLLVGEGWKRVMTTFFDEMPCFVPTSVREYIRFCLNIEEAVAQLDNFYVEKMRKHGERKTNP
ncbi:MAG TPA: LOG family protein [Anaerolineaceae bacterium]|nr:LOG family protein [Anaerolineaceae bacterium]